MVMERLCPVARIWRGETTIDRADAYEAHVRERVFPELAALAGHLGGYVLRRRMDDRVEFLVVTLWANLAAIRAFAGGDIERAVIEPAALAVLSAHDDFVRHFTVSHTAERERDDTDRAVPIFPVRSVRDAVAHYAKLGFNTSLHDPELEEPTYGFAVRKGVELHFTRVPNHDPATSASACYLHVADAAPIHAEWKAAQAGGRLTELEDKPWGKREFAHVDPDGNLVRVGSSK